MLKEKDLRKISEELLKFNSEKYSYLDAINLIFNAIEKKCRGYETCSSDIYEEVIESVLYIGEKENE